MMKRVSGILEAHGPSISHRGGMKFNYITLRQDSGKIVNIPNIVAYTNVQAAMTQILRRDENGRRVTFHLKGMLLVYALEEQGGVVHSDVDQIRGNWLTHIALTFGLMAIAALLIAFSFTFDEKGSGQIGIILFVVSIFPFLMFSGGAAWFWPSPGSAALHRRSL